MKDVFIEVEPIDDSWDRSYQDKIKSQGTYMQMKPQPIYKHPLATPTPAQTSSESQFSTMSSSNFTDVGDAPPEFSISLVLRSIRERGFGNTFNDESIGPHVHLILLISIVIVIAIAIGAIQFAFGG
jgi:hypothetical protein